MSFDDERAFDDPHSESVTSAQPAHVGSYIWAALGVGVLLLACILAVRFGLYFASTHLLSRQ